MYYEHKAVRIHGKMDLRLAETLSCVIDAFHARYHTKAEKGLLANAKAI